MPDARTPRPAAPDSVRAAALLLVLYGGLVVVHATLVQVDHGWDDPGRYARALLRLLGAGLLAGGLVRLRRWAWWLAVVLAGLLFVLAVFVAVVFALVEVHALDPSRPVSVAFLTGSIVLLGGAVGLLLSPSARAAFRRPAAG